MSKQIGGEGRYTFPLHPRVKSKRKWIVGISIFVVFASIALASIL